MQMKAPKGVVLGDKEAEGPQDVQGYVQHAVITAKDLDDEVAFWTKGLGMKKLRSVRKRVCVRACT